MDIRHLQYFLEVARQQSFTKAAEVLFITQPTISKTVKSLEDELGVTLLDRYGKRVELTDAGHVFFGRHWKLKNRFAACRRNSMI